MAIFGATAKRNRKYLAIRLSTHIYIIALQLTLAPSLFRQTRLNSKTFRLGSVPVKLKEIDRIGVDRLGGALPLEVMMHPVRRKECFVLDEGGGVWRWRLVGRRVPEIKKYPKV